MRPHTRVRRAVGLLAAAGLWCVPSGAEAEAPELPDWQEYGLKEGRPLTPEEEGRIRELTQSGEGMQIPPADLGRVDEALRRPPTEVEKEEDSNLVDRLYGEDGWYGRERQSLEGVYR